MHSRHTIHLASRRRRGFTLKELLAVIVIIVVLAFIALPALQIQRGPSRRTQCLSNLRQITAGAIAYATRNEHLPVSRSWATKSLGPNHNFPPESSDDPEQAAYSWVQPLLVDLGRPDMAEELAMASTAAQPEYGLRYDLLLCPSNDHGDEGYAALDYAINAGRANVDTAKWRNHDWKANGGSYDALRRMEDMLDHRRNRMTDADLLDGAGYTIAFAENVYLRTWCIDRKAKPPVLAITEAHSGILWDPSLRSLPAFVERADQAGGVNRGPAYAFPNSRHPGGFNIAMWDGSSRYVTSNIDYTVYARLMSSNGPQTQDPATEEFAGPTPPWKADAVLESEY